MSMRPSSTALSRADDPSPLAITTGADGCRTRYPVSSALTSGATPADPSIRSVSGGFAHAPTSARNDTTLMGVITIETRFTIHSPGSESQMQAIKTRVNQPERRRHTLTRGAFYAHLWLGVIFTVVLTAISITGILLNHKRGLGLMPDVAHEPSGQFAAALPLPRLAAIGIAAGAPGSPIDLRLVDRM